uniref:Uncharacterized protein n=1 Tax=viral metagenome TaxID=1070528 RepID=A0A6C0BPE8_9ZZZZ
MSQFLHGDCDVCNLPCIYRTPGSLPHPVYTYLEYSVHPKCLDSVCAVPVCYRAQWKRQPCRYCGAAAASAFCRKHATSQHYCTSCRCQRINCDGCQASIFEADYCVQKGCKRKYCQDCKLMYMVMNKKNLLDRLFCLTCFFQRRITKFRWGRRRLQTITSYWHRQILPQLNFDVCQIIIKYLS